MIGITFGMLNQMKREDVRRSIEEDLHLTVLKGRKLTKKIRIGTDNT